MKELVFKEKTEDLLKYWSDEKYGLRIIYSARLMGQFLVDNEPFKGKVDYFCDRDAKEIKLCKDIRVIDPDEMARKIKESGKKALIIICTGPNKRAFFGIYNDLMRHDNNADVFEYFENESCFKDRSFLFKGRIFSLFEHQFNVGFCNTRMTERCIELSLAKEYLNLCDDIVIEVGAVTPYYFHEDRISKIIDPTDDHYRVTDKKSLFDCDIKGANILCISTVEHIGTTDFGMNEKYTVVDAIDFIVSQAKSYFITAPLGYNKILDEWVRGSFQHEDVDVLIRGCNNHWEVAKDINDIENVEYTPYWANGVVIICNKWR